MKNYSKARPSGKRNMNINTCHITAKFVKLLIGNMAKVTVYRRLGVVLVLLFMDQQF